MNEITNKMNNNLYLTEDYVGDGFCAGWDDSNFTQQQIKVIERMLDIAFGYGIKQKEKDIRQFLGIANHT